MWASVSDANKRQSSLERQAVIVWVFVAESCQEVKVHGNTKTSEHPKQRIDPIAVWLTLAIEDHAA